MKARFGLALVLGALAPSCTADEPPTPAADQVEGRLRSYLDGALGSAPGVPGAILLVEAPAAGVSWRGAAGGSEKDGGEALHPDQPLRIASVTKTFVAAAVLRLAEDGALELDDPVGHHLRPWTREALGRGGHDPERITVRMLLQHTAGLPDHAAAEVYLRRVRAVPSHRWTREEQLSLAMELDHDAPEPGTGFLYSDTGYILLGEIVERASGAGLPAALRHLLAFEGLGLSSTWMESLEPVPEGVAPRAHQYFGDVDTHDFDPSMDLYGGGGLVSTLADTGAFFRALFLGEVFHQAASLDRMTTVTPVSETGTAGGYGMGLARARYAGQDCFGHGGFWGVLVRYCPETDLLVAGAVTSTSGREALDAMVAEVIAFMLREVIPDPPEVAAGAGPGAVHRPPPGGPGRRGAR